MRQLNVLKNFSSEPRHQTYRDRRMQEHSSIPAPFHRQKFPEKLLTEKYPQRILFGSGIPAGFKHLKQIVKQLGHCAEMRCRP